MNIGSLSEMERRLSGSQKLLVRGLGVLLLTTLLGWTTGQVGNSQLIDQYRAVAEERDHLRGELETVQLELDRASRVLDLSTRYGVPADLTAMIYDISLRQGIEPEMAFRLVRLESGFNPRAVSSAGALGLTQVMLATARFYEPEISAADLLDPAVNLRIGFKYLSDLLERYDDDTEMALLAYNRGPVRLAELLYQGRDPRNGYASTIMSGY